MTLIDRRYSVAEGTAVKAPCRAATTANITLGGLQTIDGIALAENDRVLVKNQSTGSQNGIYAASSGNWTRTRDFDGAFDIVSGTRVYITSGSVSAQFEYAVSTADPITVDTTSIAFVSLGQASAAASAAAAAASAAASALILTTVAGQVEYETRAAAAAASIPLAVVSIRITRFATGSAVSDAVYVPGTVSDSMAFLDAAGHYWKLDSSGRTVNPLWFGATGDAVGYTPNVTITSGQATASFSTGTFTTADAGKAIDIAGAGAAGAPLRTTILSVQSTTAITLSANASTSLVASAQVVSYGTDNTTPLQNAINAAQTYSGELDLPNGQYKTTAALSVTSRLKIRGAGAQGTTTQFYLGGGAQNIISWAGAATIIPRSNSSGINIATDDAVFFESFGVAYPIKPTALSGFTCVNLTGTSSNANSTFRDLTLAGADRGFYVTKAVHWTVQNVQFYNHVSFGIFIDQAVANVGDWDVAHNVFLSGSATACTHININGGGGGRVIGNKLDTAGSINATKGILVNPNGTSESVEPLVIVGNSIEGNNIGIHFTNPGVASTATQGVITGNQIWAANNATLATKGICIQIDSGTQWMSGYVISGNYLNTDGGAGCFNINIGNSSASNINVTGNTFNNNGLAGIACNFGTGLTNVVHYGNTAVSPTTLATAPAPAVPASTVGFTNTFFTTFVVDIYNGTGTAIFVNGNVALSQVAGTFRDHIILNPGDVISITYTVLPNWTWRSFND